MPNHVKITDPDDNQTITAPADILAEGRYLSARIDGLTIRCRLTYSDGVVVEKVARRKGEGLDHTNGKLKLGWKCRFRHIRHGLGLTASLRVVLVTEIAEGELLEVAGNTVRNLIIE
jgi:hypothetical protein